MRALGNRLPELLLAATFICSAWLKILTLDAPRTGAVLLSTTESIVGVAILEHVLAIGLFTRFCSWALRACIALAVAGVWAVLVSRWLTPQVRSTCGCLGGVRLSDGQHAALAASVLVLAAIALRRAFVETEAGRVPERNCRGA